MNFTYRGGDRPLDGYTIKRALGRGGFGEVYFAVSDGGKEVAIKLVQRNLDVELRGVMQCLNLKCPNLVTIFDVKRTPRDEVWIVMEHIAGPTLDGRLEQEGGRLSIPEAVEWLSGIASAVDYLHQQGIVHRDLKPGNVFREDSLVKLGDYGLSKFITVSHRGQQSEGIGTVHYMAPEISTGNYGKGVDLYALGVIAFELLTGEMPFDGQSSMEVLMKHLTAEPEWDRVPATYRGVLRRALAKDPSHRFASARELVDAIRAAAGLAEGGCDATAAPPPQAAPPQEVLEERPRPRIVERPARRIAEPQLDLSIPPMPGSFNAKRRAIADGLWSAFQAGLLAMLLPFVALAVLQAGFRIQPNVDEFSSLAVVTGLAAWTLLGLGRWWERVKMDGLARRLSLLAAALFLGTAAFLTDVWLCRMTLPGLAEMADFGTESFWVATLPLLLPYVATFALVFTIPDWSKTVASQRFFRFSTPRVLWIASLAVVVGEVMHRAHPSGAWLGAMAAMTALIVQWVSPHEHPRLAAAAKRRLANRQAYTA